METNTQSATAPQLQASRSGASRKLLTRKAAEQVSVPEGEPLEASFPPSADSAPDAPAVPLDGLSSALALPPAHQPPAPALWSSDDEGAFQGLLARRRAAGYKRRGKDLSTQVLRPGAIKPNPDTIVATIAGLVAEHGELSRAELLRLMAEATFPHPKAQPHDNGWCQGYVAGAIRNGFLAVAAEPSTRVGEDA